MSFLKKVETKYQAHADIVRAKPLAKVKESRPSSSSKDKVSSKYSALDTQLSSKVVGDVFKKLKSRANLNDKDVLDLARVAPRILGALLMDLKVTSKAKNTALVRKLTAVLRSQK